MGRHPCYRTGTRDATGESGHSRLHFDHFASTLSELHQNFAVETRPSIFLVNRQGYPRKRVERVPWNLTRLTPA